MAFQAARRSYTFDILWQFKDAGAVAASGAAQVGGSAKIIAVGDTFIEGVLVIDVTAIEADTGDELYAISIDGSNSATFASANANLATLRLGGAAGQGAGGAYAVSTVGHYELPFMNVQNGVQYPYLRVYTTIGGTIAAGGINYSCFAGLTPP